MLIPDENLARLDHRVERMSIVRNFGADGFDVLLRKFRWSHEQKGLIRPSQHYLDLTLGLHPRNVVVQSEYWDGPAPLGDMVYFPAGSSLSMRTLAEDRYVLCILFHDWFLDELLAQNGERPRMKPNPNAGNARLRWFMRNVLEELTTPGFASDVAMNATVEAIAVELARGNCHSSGMMTGTAAFRTRGFRAAIEYITQNLHQQIDVGGIAREAGISRRHLTRTFKTEMGQTLFEYIATSRIARAKDLLCSESMAVKEISWRCGFRSAASFSTAFRSVTGLSPREFRERRSSSAHGALNER